MSGIVLSPPEFGIEEGPAGPFFHVVLVQPRIPQNAGNIARLCAGMRAWLHVVEPLGFVLEDRYLKRAGLDYWPEVRLSRHGDLSTCEAQLPRDRTWLFAKGGDRSFWEEGYPRRGAVLVFGSEDAGLPGDFVGRWSDRVLRIPMSGALRSHNLANSVAVAGYEVLRQQGWSGESPRR
jgi:tRNA (cytidine/uridine-2'-O-)-methyltransferase